MSTIEQRLSDMGIELAEPPKPVAPATQEPVAVAGNGADTAETSVVAAEPKPEGESVNPISAEITGQQQDVSQPTSVTVQTVTQIAVPVKAPRAQPQS